AVLSGNGFSIELHKSGYYLVRKQTRISFQPERTVSVKSGKAILHFTGDSNVAIDPDICSLEVVNGPRRLRIDLDKMKQHLLVRRNYRTQAEFLQLKELSKKRSEYSPHGSQLFLTGIRAVPNGWTALLLWR